ncbi:ScbA/BarX family gamma-butyrolactone biosynthesis protein [Streptomyces kronopolitis]|uniref:ScbA/BarX family gamma-butyrolactone biosynthesis protein n=1 Tax=Streptomyces kronopolitis TaxID=1612435 RepID=UPI0036D1A6BA
MDTVEFSRTVPRELVHRLSLTEVFVTGVLARDEDTFDVGVQIPRSHAFYRDSAASRHVYDPMVLVEAARQTLIMLGHHLFEMPFGTKFILRDITLHHADLTALMVREAPTEVVLRCRVVRRFRGREGVQGARVDYSALVDGQVAATLACNMSWVTPARWQTMREERRAALGLPLQAAFKVSGPEQRIPEARVDRRDAANVVISPLQPSLPPDRDGTGTALLVVDTGHPVLFDHPLDHVPGMLILEAFRQLSIATAVETGALPSASAVFTGLRARFTGFGELDLPITCESVGAAGDGADAVLRCAMKQDGRAIADGEIRLTVPPGRRG